MATEDRGRAWAFDRHGRNGGAGHFPKKIARRAGVRAGRDARGWNRLAHYKRINLKGPKGQIYGSYDSYASTLGLPWQQL